MENTLSSRAGLCCPHDEAVLDFDTALFNETSCLVGKTAEEYPTTSLFELLRGFRHLDESSSLVGKKAMETIHHHRHHQLV